MNHQRTWRTVCRQTDLVPDSGIAVWTEAGPVAIFYLPKQLPTLFAIGHFDPISGANVLARGITGDLRGEPVVASPLYKQHYSLRTGQCLEDGDARVPVYHVLADGDAVMLEVPVARRAPAAA